MAWSVYQVEGFLTHGEVLHSNPNPFNLMIMRTYTLLSAALLATTLFAQKETTMPNGLPKSATDGSWIGISGTVESTSTGSFVLDYGEGHINVSVDQDAANPHKFKANEAVTVYGIVDDGFFTKSSIMASSVYLDSQKTYTCSTSGTPEILASFVPNVYTGTLIHGRVQKVSGTKVSVDEGARMMTVDLTAVKDKLKNEKGEITVHEGDVITAVGVMDKGFFTGRELKASSVDVMHF